MHVSSGFSQWFQNNPTIVDFADDDFANVIVNVASMINHENNSHSVIMYFRELLSDIPLGGEIYESMEHGNIISGLLFSRIESIDAVISGLQEARRYLEDKSLS